MDHETPQNTTLSPRQELALTALLAGETVTDAANTAGVDRSSLHRWLREDFNFQATRNRLRRDVWASVEARLLSLAERAAQTVGDAVEAGDVRSALFVLKGLGLLPGRPIPIGADNPETLRVEGESASRQQKQDRTWLDLIASVAVREPQDLDPAPVEGVVSVTDSTS